MGVKTEPPSSIGTPSSEIAPKQVTDEKPLTEPAICSASVTANHASTAGLRLHRL